MPVQYWDYYMHVQSQLVTPTLFIPTVRGSPGTTTCACGTNVAICPGTTSRTTTTGYNDLRLAIPIGNGWGRCNELRLYVQVACMSLSGPRASDLEHVIEGPSRV